MGLEEQENETENLKIAPSPLSFRCAADRFRFVFLHGIAPLGDGRRNYLYVNATGAELSERRGMQGRSHELIWGGGGAIWYI